MVANALTYLKYFFEEMDANTEMIPLQVILIARRCVSTNVLGKTIIINDIVDDEKYVQYFEEYMISFTYTYTMSYLRPELAVTVTRCESNRRCSFITR